MRYTSEGGWTLGPDPQDAAGEPLSGFTLEQSPLAGQMTPHGAGVLAGTVVRSGVRVALRRCSCATPGGAFKETSPVPAEGETLKAGEEPLLKKGEALFGSTRAPLIAPLDEGGRRSGRARRAGRPSGEGVENRVLHWDGKRWTPEPIEIPKASSEDFRVLAIAASSPSNAWLLAQLSSGGSYPKGALALFLAWRPRNPVGGAGNPSSSPPAPPNRNRSR